MPTYEYRCASCEHQFERFQRMADEPVKECERCGGPVQRLLFAVPVHFKGKGFYTTDYGRKSKAGSGNGSGSSGNGSRPDHDSEAPSAKPEKAEPACSGTTPSSPVD